MNRSKTFACLLSLSALLSTQTSVLAQSIPQSTTSVTANITTLAPSLVSVPTSAETQAFARVRTFAKYVTQMTARLEHLPDGNTQAEEVRNIVQSLLKSDAALRHPQLSVQLAEQILKQTAMPAVINQGRHNTCAVAALEVRMYTRCPSTVARMVADIFCRSAFTLPSGQVVTLSATSVQPDQEAVREATSPHNRGDRSYAAQLFQLGAVNAYWLQQNHDPRGIKVPRASITYEQISQDNSYSSFDTCERLLIHWPGGVVETVFSDNNLPLAEPAFSLAEIRETYKLLTTNNEDFAVAHKAYQCPGLKHKVGSSTQLAGQLAKLKASDLLPAVTTLPAHGNADRTPSSNADGTRAATILSASSSANSWHAISIIDYDQESGQVTISNSATTARNANGTQTMPIDDLYHLTCGH